MIASAKPGRAAVLVDGGDQVHVAVAVAVNVNIHDDDYEVLVAHRGAVSR